MLILLLLLRRRVVLLRGRRPGLSWLLLRLSESKQMMWLALCCIVTPFLNGSLLNVIAEPQWSMGGCSKGRGKLVVVEEETYLGRASSS
jgi:hypothetical protein